MRVVLLDLRDGGLEGEVERSPAVTAPAPIPRIPSTHVVPVVAAMIGCIE